MPTEKVSLTLDQELVAEARERAGPAGLSALVNDALAWQLQRDRIGQLLDDLDAEHGPVEASVIDEAVAERRAAIHGRRKARRRAG